MSRVKPVGYLIVMALLLLASIFSVKMFFQERNPHDNIDVSAFPYTLGEWRGKDMKIEQYEYDILETRNLIIREYSNPANEKIYMFIIYSETNRSVFHPPEVCLIGSGVNIVNKRSDTITVSDKQSFSINKLDLTKGDFKELSLYCYKAGALYTDNFYFQQLYLAAHQIFGASVPGATIRLTTPLSGRDEKKCLEELKEFMKKVVVALDSLVPAHK